MADSRKHDRIRLPAAVKVSCGGGDEFVLNMYDISHGGVFLLCGQDVSLRPGDIVKIQVQGMMEDAPIIEAEVLRKNDKGIALKFLSD